MRPFLSTALYDNQITLQGWFAVRHEIKQLLAVFLFLGIFYITSWGVMFILRSSDGPSHRGLFSLPSLSRLPWCWLQVLSLVSSVEIILTRGLRISVCFMFVPSVSHKLTRYAVAVYVEDVLGKANFHPGVFTNDTNNVERASLDSMRILSSKGTKFIVPTNPLFL